MINKIALDDDTTVLYISTNGINDGVELLLVFHSQCSSRLAPEVGSALLFVVTKELLGIDDLKVNTTSLGCKYFVEVGAELAPFHKSFSFVLHAVGSNNGVDLLFRKRNTAILQPTDEVVNTSPSTVDNVIVLEPELWFHALLVNARLELLLYFGHKSVHGVVFRLRGEQENVVSVVIMVSLQLARHFCHWRKRRNTSRNLFLYILPLCMLYV